MKSWLNFERAFLDTLLESVLPGSRLGPGTGDPAFWDELERAAPPLLLMGLRIDAWVLGSWLGLLSPSRRDRCLTHLARSRFHLVRQLVLTAKLVVALAHFVGPHDELDRARTREEH